VEGNDFWRDLCSTSMVLLMASFPDHRDPENIEKPTANIARYVRVKPDSTINSRNASGILLQISGS